MGPSNSSCSLRHTSSLSGCTDQCNLIVLNLFSSASALTQVLWKKLPVPFGVDNIIDLPPVASVCCADAHISSILSINAASSNTNNDKASDLPASPAAETAFI